MIQEKQDAESPPSVHDGEDQERNKRFSRVLIGGGVAVIAIATVVGVLAISGSSESKTSETGPTSSTHLLTLSVRDQAPLDYLFGAGSGQCGWRTGTTIVIRTKDYREL